MPTTGRPRLKQEEYQARVDAYCAKYGVARNSEGVPPFPRGKRETDQHREWLKLYKTHQRLARRQNGQCQHCRAPVSEGSVCEAHRAANSARTGSHGASAGPRRALLEVQGGRCPICGERVEVWDSLDHCHGTRKLRAIMHQACNQLVGAAESLGPEALDRVRAYLWPEAPRPRRQRG